MSVQDWFYDLVADLQEIWVQFFSMNSSETFYYSRGEKIVLPAFMFKYYEEKARFQNLFQLVFQIFHAPNFSVENQRVLLRPSEIRHWKPYEEEIYQRAMNGEDMLVQTWESRLTTQTEENRFIAVFLEMLISHMTRLAERLDNKTQALSMSENKDPSPAMESPKNEADSSQTIVNELKNLRGKAQEWVGKFSGLRRLGFLADLPWNLPMPSISERMLSKPLYRKVWEFYREYSRSLVSQNLAGIELAFLANWRVYELWILFRVRDLMREIEGKEELLASKWELPDNEPLLIDDEGRANNVFNQHFTFSWKDKTLHYQMPVVQNGKKYTALTHDVRPDIVLEKDERLVILDAKHKDFGQLWANPNTQAWNPKSDWDQMHTYRDNIRLAHSIQISPVQAAILIFSGGTPGPAKNKLLQEEYIREIRIGSVRVNDKRDIQKLEGFLKL